MIATNILDVLGVVVGGKVFFVSSLVADSDDDSSADSGGDESADGNVNKDEDKVENGVTSPSEEEFFSGDFASEDEEDGDEEYGADRSVNSFQLPMEQMIYRQTTSARHKFALVKSIQSIVDEID